MSESQKFDLKTSEGGRGFIANLFVTVLRRHDFTAYIKERLAADFACALSQFIACAQARESELQKRLTAADERADVQQQRLTELQRQLGERWSEISAYQDTVEKQSERADVLEGWLRRWSTEAGGIFCALKYETDAALKPADGGGDEALSFEQIAQFNDDHDQRPERED